MSVAGLSWQTWSLALAVGQNQKSDPRALPMVELAKVIDAQFDEHGGLQTRRPYDALAIAGGGTLSDVRKVVENGDELLCFTKDTLYSRNVAHSKWTERGTHLAVKMTETSRFVTTGEQVDCDRAELSGTIVYVWTELVGATSKGYVAAIDKTTGSVLMAPTALAGSASRLRATALSTKILVTFYDNTNGLYAYALDPASPSTALAGASTTVTNTNYGERYDIVKIPSADQAVFACRRNPTTSYLVGTITAGLVVATSTKARVCEDAIAVAVDPTATYVQVVRSNTTNIQGDLITLSGLVDTAHVATAIGTAGSNIVNQIAAAFRSVQNSGAYRCYAFWSYSEVGTSGLGAEFSTKSNWVDTAGSLGSEGQFVDYVGPASRAFDHEGRIYLWLAFTMVAIIIDNGGSAVQTRGSLQNTYFLYRDDAFLVAKAAPGVAGGYANSTGALPNVTSTDANTYSWCGVERRVLDPAANLTPGYSARAPRDITFEFDSNEARRCARLGPTLYVTGGEILQYDGRGLYEVGFHVTPWYLELSSLAAGSLAAGSYGYKATWRWDNARGERERSTTAASGLATIAANNTCRIESYHALHHTHKTTTGNVVAQEVWRTAVNPTDDSPFYLVSGVDPTVVTGDNCYIPNDHTAYDLADLDDDFTDAIATTKEGNNENGGVLENLAPPAASIILANDTRLFLAGVSGDPDRVWYSKQYTPGEVAAFNDALVISVPTHGGVITALAELSETLVVFRETAIYALPGSGFDNTGGGFNYSPARAISTDIGAVNHESVAVSERGLVFKSNKGWYLLDRGWSLHYIGAGFADYDDETPVAVHVVQSQHQIRALTSERMLVFDTLVEPWRCAEWTIVDGVSACMWNGAHVYATDSSIKQQVSTFTTMGYGMVIETAWIQMPDGCMKVDHLQVLGEYRSAHRLKIECARDFWKDGDATFFQTKTWTVSPATVGAREKVKHAPSIKAVEALKIRLTVLDSGADSAPTTGECVKLTSIAFELGFERRGLTRNLPAAQKQ